MGSAGSSTQLVCTGSNMDTSGYVVVVTWLSMVGQITEIIAETGD